MDSTNQDFVFSVGGHAPKMYVAQGEPFTVFTEDCFSGCLSSVDGQPREVAPYPRVNPLTGPIHVEGIAASDIVAIRLIDLKPARDWGVATVSPDFGLLSGTRSSPNLQVPQDEHVWIWRFAPNGQSLATRTKGGRTLIVPYRPFHGTLGVAPAHGEVRLAVASGDYGGNLDIPDLGPGSTLYVRANVEGAHIYVGDGHYAQGDGEIAGTAIEGAFNTTLMCERVEMDDTFDWPRFENEDIIGVIGCARPLDDGCRIAVAGLVRWVARRAGLEMHDAHQLVTQCCRLRIGNLVNPSFSVMCSIPKARLSFE